MKKRITQAARQLTMLTLLSLLSGCATSGADRRLQSLEAENAKLRGEYAEAMTAAKAGYDGATQAETRAGIAGQPCTVVSPTSGEPQPRAGAVHGKVRLSAGNSAMTVQPAAARTQGGVRIAPATCNAGRR